MARGHFDTEGFQAALDGVRQTRKKTWKQLADESQVSASTLTRMGQGRRPDVDSLAALSKWSGIDLDEFVINGLASHRAGADTLAELTALFRGPQPYARRQKSHRDNAEGALRTSPYGCR